jgi:hypothetical protein
VPGEATRHSPREVVEERDATAVDLGDHRDRAPRPRIRRQLLDIRAAEAARRTGTAPSGSGTPTSCGRPLSVDNDRAHRSIVGPWRSSSTGAPTSGRFRSSC